MGLFRETEDDLSEAGIDMSPLIDCVFILLIFFIVTTVFVEETGIEVDKPQPASSAQLESTSIVIGLTESGQVIHGGAGNGREIGLSGVQPLVKSLLSGATETVPVLIQADAGAQTGTLVRIVDAARLAGAEKVSLSTRKSRG